MGRPKLDAGRRCGRLRPLLDAGAIDRRQPGHLTLSGFVANAIKPWAEILGESAAAEIRVDGELPYLVPQEGTVLWRVLNDEWDRDDVLSRIRHALP